MIPSFFLRPYCIAYALLLGCLVVPHTASAQGQIFCVRSGATGANDGSDWKDAFTALPNNLIRGATYYIADGDYAGYQFDDPVSGTDRITIKKATVADHGAEAEWADVFGDGSAIFNGDLRWYSSGGGGGYYTMDGNQANPAPHGIGLYGFEVRGTMRVGNYSQALVRDYLFRNIDVNPNNIPLGRGFRVVKVHDIVVRHCRMRNCDEDPLFTDQIDGITVEYSHFGPRIFTGNGAHGDAGELRGTDNGVLRYNTVDWNGQQWFFSTPSHGRWDIYGNIQYGGPTSGKIMNTHANLNGLELYYYNNTVYNINAGFIMAGSGETGVIRNNIFYKINNWSGLSGFTHDYNYFDSAFGDQGEANDISGGDPFQAAANKDFTLSQAIAGQELDPVYGMDLFDNVRGEDGDATWDRGAIEFGANAGSPLGNGDGSGGTGGGGQGGGGPPVDGPLEIFGVSVPLIASNSAQISWSTNKAATGEVEFGLISSSTTTEAASESAVQQSLILDGLAANSVYQFHVRSFESNGDVVYAGPFTFQTTLPDVSPPDVRVTLQPQKETGFQEFLITASDNYGGSGLASVHLNANAQLLGTATRLNNSEFGFKWDTLNFPNGSYLIEAVATDVEGNLKVSSTLSVTVNDPPVDFQTGLVGHWSFDQVSGALVGDLSVEGNSGTLASGASQGSGVLGPNGVTQGLALDGVDDHLVVPNSASLDLAGNEFTLATWCRLSSSGNWQTILGKVTEVGDHISPWYAYDLAIRHEGGQFRPRVGATNASGVRVTTYANALYDYDAWHHFVGVYNGTDLIFYVDGFEKGRLPLSGSVISYDQPLFIGRNGDGGGDVKGDIDDVRVYNRALGSSDVRALYRQTVPAAPVGLEPLVFPVSGN